jgi:gentisate 1,2-dioxygenase
VILWHGILELENGVSIETINPVMGNKTMAMITTKNQRKQHKAQRKARRNARGKLWQ